jgi:hypothetical protein
MNCRHVIFHVVMAKKYNWRNYIHWRNIFKISVQPSLFPIGSLAELLVSIGQFSCRLCSQRAASVVVNYTSYLYHNRLLHIHIDLESDWYTVIWQNSSINIISPICFHLNRGASSKIQKPVEVPIEAYIY